MTVYLASRSPRRLALSRQMGLAPELLSGADIDESIGVKEQPRVYAARMAREKSLAAQGLLHQAQVADVIITADTVVAVGRRVLCKAEDADQAQRHLRLLSGRRHRVFGGVAVAMMTKEGWELRERLSETRVKFARLTEQDIEQYVKGDEWHGCAGGYAIQGTAGRFVAQLQGSYSNVVGLDIHQLWRLLSSTPKAS